MRKFLLYLFSLIICFVVILLLLEQIYTNIYKNGLARNKVAYLMTLEGQEIDYIFLGSSRVDNTIDARIIEQKTGKRAINLGIQSAKLDDYLLLLKLIDQLNIKTNKIFVQIDYVYNLTGNSKILNSYLMPYAENPIFKDHLKRTLNDFWWIENIPFYRYLKYDYKIGFREAFSTGIGKSTEINFENGYYPKNGYSGAPLKAKLSSVIEPNNLDLNEIIAFSKATNIDLVFFTAPFCPKTENLDFVLKLEKKLPVLWNFSSLLKSNDYFYDCLHVNIKGANIFSTKFSERINLLEKEN